MATTNSKRSSSRKSSKKKKEYEEQLDWGSAFHRPDNEDHQPAYTGEGILDDDTLAAIQKADGRFEIAVWPRRAKSSGLRYLRIHISEPYQGDDSDDDDEDRDDAEIPF